MIKLKVSHIRSGSMMVHGQSFEVVDWHVEVPDMHVANFMIENSGCKMTGADRLMQAKKIIVKRTQGLGDVLMATPIMRKIKELIPDSKITFACFPMFVDVCKYLPYVDEVVSSQQLRYHEDAVWVEKADGSQDAYDHWVNLDGVERLSDADLGGKHRVNLFAEMAAIPLQEPERRLDYIVTEEEHAWAKQKFTAWNLDGLKVLGMAVRSTAANRNMPQHKFHRIAELAVQAGWKVIVFDHDGVFGWQAPGVIDMAGKTSIREMGALLSCCSMFFGPDTGAWHLACAVNVPNVVYFGAINWKLRVTMPRTRVLFKNVACYPCDRYDCHWTEKHACIALTPERCFQEIDSFDRDLSNSLAPVVDPWTPRPELAQVVSETAGYKNVGEQPFIIPVSGVPLVH